jgi:hypothetical protein
MCGDCEDFYTHECIYPRWPASYPQSYPHNPLQTSTRCGRLASNELSPGGDSYGRVEAKETAHFELGDRMGCIFFQDLHLREIYAPFISELREGRLCG